MRLKYILRKVERDRGDFKHDHPPMWIVADPPWTSMPLGAVTSSKPLRPRLQVLGLDEGHPLKYDDGVLVYQNVKQLAVSSAHAAREE